MIQVKMLYFAQAREAAGTRGEEVSLTGSPRISNALSRAFMAHPRLKGLEKMIKVALNEEIVEDDSLLSNGDRVALLPPVVGG